MESNINYIWGLLIRNIEWSRKIIQPGCSPGMGLKIREKNSINFSLPSTPSLPFIIDSTRGLMMRSNLSGWEDSLEGRPGRADRCCLCWRAERPGLTGAGCQSHRRPGGAVVLGHWQPTGSPSHYWGSKNSFITADFPDDSDLSCFTWRLKNNLR